MTSIHRIACPIPFPLKSVNCYYISDACPTLVDTGVHTADSLNGLEAAIRQQGGSLEAIRRVIVTHAHSDHAGLAGWLARAFGAEVFIHRADFPKFISADRRQSQRYFQQFKAFLDFGGVPADQGQALSDDFAGRVRQLVAPLEAPRLLAGGETFIFDDFELQVRPTPGHSAGSISLIDAAKGLMFSGDFLLEHITPNPVAEFGAPDGPNAEGSLARFTASLQWMEKQDVTRVLPGHGPAFSGARQRAAAILDHFERRRQRVYGLVAREAAARSAQGGVTLLELARRMFPGLREMAVFLGLSEAYAYVQALASDGRLEIRMEKGVGRWRPRG